MRLNCANLTCNLDHTYRADMTSVASRHGKAAAAMVICIIAAIGAPPAQAEPADGAQSPAPYPELRYFSEIDSSPYYIDGQGFWFVTAQGLNCGIWIRGSFGCSGDIPGAPPSVQKIGWIDRDTRVHYDWTLAIRFPPTRGTLSIPPLSYITSEGTTCATTVDFSTYCVKGPWRLLITPSQTWLNG
jgi:hypothetical protein